MVGWNFFVPWPLRPLLMPSTTGRRDELALNPSSLMSLSSLQQPVTIGLKLLYAGENPVFDIVAVHGLGGEAFRTWTWKATKKGEKDVLWLRDLLPNEIQDARIFTYGYDSMPAQVAGRASTKFIHQHAEAFLHDLYAHRKGDEVYRPIVFIAHSLGGILVKQALINANDCHVGHNEHLRSILNSTYGIMFMGTPHNGSGLATWGKFAESVISHVFPKSMVDTTPHLINTLGRNSEVLQIITRQFASIHHNNSFRIFFFFEELKTKLPNGRMEMVVEYSSAVSDGIADAQIYGIHGDHHNISRFENEESSGYAVLVRALIEWREAAPEAINLKWAQYRDQVTLRAMHTNSLSPKGSHIGSPPSRFMLPGPSENDTHERRMVLPAQEEISPHSSIVLSPIVEPQFLVPHHPNKVFEGRQEDLERLDKILQSPKRGNTSAVVSGIPGSGKTHLVRQYIYEYRDNYPGGVFWVESMSSATIRLGYWKLAMGLGLTDSSRFSEEPHHDSFVQLVIDWFKANTKWLLVLDGADHETEEEVDMLKEIIPGGSGGAIIITTVNKDLTRRARLGSPEGVHLGNLRAEDCINMLFKYADIEDPDEEDISDARELVELMDLLPLAIHSAGSAMRAMQMDLGSYLRHYKRQPKVEGLTSFHIILDQLQKRYSEASNLIYILSFVERKVPVAMMEWGIKGWAGPPLIADRDGFGLNATLKHLLTYSLIERKSVAEIDDPGRVDTLLVHKVVQDICRLRMIQEGSREEWFYYASKIFCKSFRRMERRRRDKNFSVSDYRRFQVHIAKLLGHGKAMKLDAEELEELEETLTRIKNAIDRYTPRYSSQSTDDGDGDYMPPRSQFRGSWSSLDESSGSASEAVNAEIVIAPEYIVDSPLDHYGPQFPFTPSGYETTSPTITASGSPRQRLASPNKTPSPGMISAHPFGLPGGSPPSAPPPLLRQYITGLTPRNPNAPFSPPYPPSPGGATTFPASPHPLGVYDATEHLNATSAILARNHSDDALVKARSGTFFEKASRSQGDLTNGRGRRLTGSLPISRETSMNPLRSNRSREPSRTREYEFGGVGMARVRSEESQRSLKHGQTVAQKLSSEAMSRSTSTGSAPGGVPLTWPGPAEPRSRRGSVASNASVSSRYHKLSSRQSLPIPTISSDSDMRVEKELLPEERRGYHTRQGSAPGVHVEEGYDSGVDGVGGRVIEFSSPPILTVEGNGSRRGSVAGLGISLHPTANPAEYLAASRRSSAPGAVQDPHHHTLQQHQRPHPAHSPELGGGSTSHPNSPPPGIAPTAPVFPRSPSPASLLEAAGGAPMQRSASEPPRGSGEGGAGEPGGLFKTSGFSRSLRRAMSPLGRKKGKKYSPREAFLENAPAEVDEEEPLFESWAEEDDIRGAGKGKGKARMESLF